MVNVSNYESAGLDSNPGTGSRRVAHLAIHPSFGAGRQMGSWGNLGKLNRGNPDITLPCVGSRVLSPPPHTTHSYSPQLGLYRWNKV